MSASSRPPAGEVRMRIGGPAGFGIKAAGQSLARVFAHAGFHTFDLTEYPSLIKGGHNTYHLRVSEQPIYSHVMPTDVLVALDRDTVGSSRTRAHRGRCGHLRSGRPESQTRPAWIAERFCLVPVPLTEIVRDIGGRQDHAQRGGARSGPRPHGLPARGARRVDQGAVRAQSARDRRAERRGRARGLRARAGARVRVPAPPHAADQSGAAPARRRQRGDRARCARGGDRPLLRLPDDAGLVAAALHGEARRRAGRRRQAHRGRDRGDEHGRRRCVRRARARCARRRAAASRSWSRRSGSPA